MFNDLTGANDESASKVDDIFAETDKTSANGAGAQIETRPAGLSANTNYAGQNGTPNSQVVYEDEEGGGHKGGKALKIAIIAAIVAIVILGGYLAYSKFLAPNPEMSEIVPPSASENTEVIPPVEEKEDDGFVKPSAGKDDTASSTEEAPVAGNNEAVDTPLDTDSDGLSDAEEIALGTDATLIDSDSDALNDFLEVKTHKTDPLKADTDGDTLSDYEEINNWGTNPLNIDTDGDTYNDASEIKSGYNPNGEGKLPGITQ